MTATPPVDAFYDDFDFYVREQGAREWELRVTSRAPTAQIEFPDYGTYEIAIAGRTNGTLAAPDQWTELVFVAGSKQDFAAPDTPTNFRAAQDGSVVRASWDALEDDAVEAYEIRSGSFWETGRVEAHVAAGASQTSFAPWCTGPLNLFLKAITKQGLESEDAATLPVPLTVTADQYGPVQGTHDEQSGGFSGTKADTTTSGGDLVQSALPATGAAMTGLGSSYSYPFFGRYVSGGTYVTAWQDAGVACEERVEVSLASAVDAVMPLGSQLARPVRRRVDENGVGLRPGERSLFSRLSGAGTLRDGFEVQVEIDTAQDAVPTSDGWRRWVPGAVYTYRQVRLRFTLVCPWTFARLRLPSLTWYRRRQNRKDEGTVNLGGTGGTTITFTAGRFTVAPYVNGNVISATDALYVTVSNITTTAAKVRAWDATGTEVGAGTVHWHALGI